MNINLYKTFHAPPPSYQSQIIIFSRRVNEAMKLITIKLFIIKW